MISGDSNRLSDQPAFDRDDRTVRILESMVGDARVDLSLTHFTRSKVELWVDEETMQASNGFLSVITALNMLARFVGVVELHVIGEPRPGVRDELMRALERLRQIDTRPGHVLRQVLHAVLPPIAQSCIRIWMGLPENPDHRHSLYARPRDIHVSFDAWTCALSRRGPRGKVRASSIPIGALVAACLAVAEAFKSLVADSLPISESESFGKRFTHEFRFDAWSMECITLGGVPAVKDRPESLPALDANSVLQVGAGAVGNGSALVFSSVPAIFGELLVLDTKLVDWRNLNRCYYFTEGEVSSPKVRVLELLTRREGFRVRGHDVAFSPQHLDRRVILLSTVDNNEVRHRMQEALPDVLIQGSTGATTVAISVHRPGNGRSCLVCRHPDANVGITRRTSLSVEAAAHLTGLKEEEIETGRVDGSMEITDALIARVAARSLDAAEVLRRGRDSGQDVCGALGNLRTELGNTIVPQEASVPFVSNLAGVLAAAEVVKHLMRAAGAENVPELGNVLQIDLGRDYSRPEKLSFAEPPRADCALCVDRADGLSEVLAQRTLARAHRRAS